MPYLIQGGARLFRHDTRKDYLQIGPISIAVSGSNLLPIIDALTHYEAVVGDAAEREAALCSVMSKCRKWHRAKATKVAASGGNPDATVQIRKRAVTALLNEAVAAMLGATPGMARAFDTYAARKERGHFATQPLAGGYANERTAYVKSGKARSISGSLIDDLVKDADPRVGPSLSAPNKAKLANQYGAGTEAHRSFDSLTEKDWQKIEKIATELTGRMLETKYMTRHERLSSMLESDGAGGLRFLVGLRPAAAAGNGVWPYAMDEWGNIYTADDRTDEALDGYALFNHSSFTAGDRVVCAGMLKIDVNGRLVQIDTNSGHYKPTNAQLKVVVAILRDEYHVDFSRCEIITMVPQVVWGIGEIGRFLSDQVPLPRRYNKPLPQPPGN